LFTSSTTIGYFVVPISVGEFYCKTKLLFGVVPSAITFNRKCWVVDQSKTMQSLMVNLTPHLQLRMQPYCQSKWKSFPSIRYFRANQKKRLSKSRSIQWCLCYPLQLGMVRSNGAPNLELTLFLQWKLFFNW
jgi:hypothetical protein